MQSEIVLGIIRGTRIERGHRRAPESLIVTPKRVLVTRLQRRKASFRLRLNETEFLNVSVFPTKKDPTAEVISVQVNRLMRARST